MPPVPSSCNWEVETSCISKLRFQCVALACVLLGCIFVGCGDDASQNKGALNPSAENRQAAQKEIEAEVGPMLMTSNGVAMLLDRSTISKKRAS